MTSQDVAAALASLADEIEACRACALGSQRTRSVPGVGNPNSDVMFIGEAPGFHEDQQGEPFVGASGQLLTKLIETKLGLKRSDVWIANTLRCLRYNAMIQLGDGSWERICRLVSARYNGDVMSVDADGRLVRRRVIGWYTSPLANRSVYRLTYRTAKNAGSVQVAVQLTGDHEVLTDEGYVAVQDLKPGALIATGQGLSPLAFDVVCGSLLGDSYLSAKAAHLTMSHSARHRDYVTFKGRLLKELQPRIDDVMMSSGGTRERIYPSVHLRTLAHRALGTLRKEFYQPTKRVPAWMASGLTDRMLAIWFMDDGYTRIRPGGRRPGAEIATCSFDEEDLNTLTKGLAGLGLSAKTIRGRLHFDVVNTRRLCELIAPFTPPVMRYKLDPEVEASIPFNPSRFEPGEPEVLYDEAVVQDITLWERNDATFYCIDVEETHNFVTTGGVVHNCRPPGNRDPLPAEIESCKPFLARQLKLIRPRIVVTLGNFAGKLLTGSSLGVTKLREREWHLRDGTPLMCTFHPAAALRGGNAANGIAADFDKIRKVLEELPQETQAPPEQLGLF